MINNIQALRAFAAINVVFFHVIMISTSYGQGVNIFAVFEGWGKNGVDLFFVISGFVMMHTQIKNKKSIGAFLKSRIIRIVPMYWLVTLFVITLYLVFPSIFRSIVFEPTYILSSFLFVSQISVDAKPILAVGWTLEWEVLFYIIFSLSLLLKNWRLVMLTIGLALVFVAIITETWLIIEFFFGMVIAYVFNLKKINETNGFLIFGFGFILLLLSINNINTFQIDRLIMWGVPSTFIVFGLLYARQTNSRVLIYLGDASYSIYIIHSSVLSVFYKLSLIYISSLNYDFLAIICLCGSVAFGCLTYSFIEKPITNRLKKRAQKTEKLGRLES